MAAGSRVIRFPCVLFFVILSIAFACDDSKWWTCKETFLVKENGDGQTCLFAKFDADLEIKYLTKENEKMTTTVKVPHNDSKDVTLANSFCFNGSNTSSLDLTWNHGDYNLKLDFFSQPSDTGRWYMSSISIEFNATSLNNSKETGMMSATKVNDNAPGLFSQPYPKSYYYFCNSIIDFPVNETVVTLRMSNARLFPFISPQGATKWLCTKDAENEGKIVPIVVGAVIAFLMLSIFIIYVVVYTKRKISERRSRQAYATLSSDSDQ